MKLCGRNTFTLFHDGPLPVHASKIKHGPERRLYSSSSDVFITYRDVLVVKDFNAAHDEDHIEIEYPDPKVKVLRSPSGPTTCLGVANTSFLVCTCTDDAVYLWKKDSLLREWARKKVVKSSGRILHCAVFSTGKEIFICLSKAEELVVIRCLSHVHLEANGSLDLADIQIYASIESIKEPNFWIRCFLAGGKLNILGLAHGCGISLRLWQVASQKEGVVVAKLMDHKTVPQIKSIASADVMMGNGDEVYLALFGCEGQMEILLIDHTFHLINRIKVDDSSTDSPLSPKGLNLKPSQSTSGMKAEFRVLAGRFLETHENEGAEFGLEEYAPDSSGDFDQDRGDSGREHNNSSFMLPSHQRKCLCPKLLALIASSSKICVVNLRSGEAELAVKFEELDRGIGVMVNSVTLSFDQESSEIVGAMELLMDKNVYFFRLPVQTDRDNSHDDCFLTSVNEYNPRSVLRKKLKSPRNHSRSKAGNCGLGLKKKSKSRSRTFSSLSAATLKASNSGLLTKSFGTGVAGVELPEGGKIRWNSRPSGDFSPSPRSGTATPGASLDLSTSANYRNGEKLVFDWSLTVQVPVKLAEKGISSARLVQSADGKLMAAGANVSPLLVFKTQPFESLRMFKDSGKVSSLQFSFDSKLLLVATNDSTSTVLNWRQGKELFHIKFPTRFNENIGSQFYFMDKFLLQPEENRLAFYSYALRDSGAVHLKAADFPLDCQCISAVAAPNQFYSNYVVCGLSSKALQVFDSNAEKVAFSVPQAHTRPITCIRLNEAPKASHATELCNYILTAAPSSADPLKLWDLRFNKCVSVIGDVNANGFVPTTRPALSPCGRYIASGFEDNKVVIYDVRRINSRVCNLQGFRSTVLDCSFDPNLPLLWCAGKNGTIWSCVAT